MSPNPPRQQHREGNTSRNLIAPSVPQQREKQAPAKKGRETRCTPSTLRAFCLCWGSTIILLEERDTSLVILR